MKRHNKLLLILAAVTLIAGGCTTKPPDTGLDQQGNAVAASGGAVTQAKNTPSENKTTNAPTDLGPPPEQQQNEIPATQALSYTDYSTDTLASAQKSGKKVVLFFYADWCPFCVEADKQFKAKLDQIPKGVTILKTDYDTETALKKKYVITYQHTLVQIDASGNLVSKWNGGDVENLIKYIK